MDLFLKCGPFSARSRDSRVLFESVELVLPESVFAVLSGPSGCGKTTLLQMIAGLRHAPAATRELGGRLFHDNVLPEWRGRVLLMMQNAPLFSGSVELNLKFPFSLGNSGDRQFAQDRAMSLMRRIGLSHIAMDQEARQLSGGERHRLALVRALLWSPDVILADEPLAGLDSINARKCLEMLVAFAHKPGRAVLCAMHDTGYGDFIDLALVMRNNRLETVRP